MVYSPRYCTGLLATFFASALLTFLAPLSAEEDARDGQARFTAMDVFGLEYAARPQIAPDGGRIVYERHFMDLMKDVERSSLWIVNFDGSEHRPLTTGNADESQPVWSPDGKRLVYVSSENGSTQLYLRWMDTGQTARLTQLTRAPSSLSFSPDGRWIAFSMLVPQERTPLVQLPKPPKGAEWAEPPKVIDKLTYRFDGRGYLENGFQQLFVVPAEGGTPRQLTFGAFHHEGPVAWAPDSASILFSANLHEDWERDPVESEIYELRLADGELAKLTERDGPDRSPVVSPDGRWIAYVGYDDRLLGYHNARIYVMKRDGSESRSLTEGLDRSVVQPEFAASGEGVYFSYDDHGDTRIAYVSLEGQIRDLADHVGGTSLGRPYSGGSYSVSQSGRIAYTHTGDDHPADVATAGEGLADGKRITELNRDLFGHKKLGEVEEVVCRSSHDGREIQAWLVKPPDFDATRKYPLILEIHGGPFANYGRRFTAEIQLYAAAGYVVLYVNPRGSTGYGSEFANLIHHNYPGEDYDDLMSAVDAVIGRGYVDPRNLFVTGGSGGGVLSAWIIGKTDRFRAAVVAKPVINWYSFVLTADSYNFFYRYWFAGFPWDDPEQYLRRSPISLVGNVTTPTMLITGEADYRTPISESEQLYQALKLRRIETALVRIPGASHSISARPSRLIAKTSYVLAWFDRHKAGEEDQQE